MTKKEILKIIKKYVLEELYDSNKIYFGLILEVNYSYMREIEYLGGYDWKYISGAYFEKKEYLILKKVHDELYQDIKTKKIYKTTNLKLDYSEMKKGEQYISANHLITYKKAFKDDTRHYLTYNEIEEQLLDYYHKRVKNKIKKK